MKGPITQERMEQALDYLSDTDESCAALRADMARTEFKAKAVRAAMVKLSPGTSASAREAEADTSKEVADAWETHFKAMREHDAMKNKRATQAIVFEAWRSLNSNRRQAQ